MKIKILVLGHNGLLGNTAYKYLNQFYDVKITDLRWDNPDFKAFVRTSGVDYIINCIGKIPQRKPNVEQFDLVNYQLPKWLDGLGIKIIHPDTDENGDDSYSISKIKFREEKNVNTKVIRTSIIGHELKGCYSLLDWFLSSDGTVNGFTNQFWNGNTTLEWSKWCEKIINDWNKYDNEIVLSNPDCLSKYDILKMMKEVYNKNIEIIPIEASLSKNNCLESNFTTKSLQEQLIELKNF